MKTQLTIAAAVLTLAACTPKFYPPQVATPESYVYGAGFSSDTTGVANAGGNSSATRRSTRWSNRRWRTTATWP